MDSEWHPIPNFEGHYWINTKGNIKSKTGRLLKLRIGNTGYWYTTLSKHGKVSTFTVHRLLAKIFIPNPHKYTDVCHNDSNSLNMELYNLRWDTRSGNMKDADTLGRRIKGTKHHFTHLTDRDILDIRDAWDSDKRTQSELASRYEVGQDQISRIVNRKSWNHI